MKWKVRTGRTLYGLVLLDNELDPHLFNLDQREWLERESSEHGRDGTHIHCCRDEDLSSARGQGRVDRWMVVRTSVILLSSPAQLVQFVRRRRG